MTQNISILCDLAQAIRADPGENTQIQAERLVFSLDAYGAQLALGSGMQEVALNSSRYSPKGSAECCVEDVSLAKTAIELRHLRYFVAVAEHLNFGKAARALNVSQPPLSRQIRDLERYLGVSLFYRNPKGVSLTGAGQLLLGESRRILDELALSVRLVRRAAGGVSKIPVV